MVTAERERQIRENLGLVHTVANRFRGRGIEYDDLYQSGCVGLIKAVEKGLKGDAAAQTRALLEKLLKMVRDLGQDRTFAYMKFLLGCEKDY